MKVKLIKENTIIEVNDSYGLRLITQGKAVAAAKDAPAKAKAEKTKGDA